MTATPLISSGAGAGVVTRSQKRIENAAGDENNEESGENEEERKEEREGDEDENVEIEGDEDVEMSEDSADEEPVAKKCGCVNRPVVIAKLAAAKKRGFTDRSIIIQDVKFLTSGAMNKMCWPHLRRCAAIVGLKTQVGGRNTLVKIVDCYEWVQVEGSPFGQH